MMSTAIEVMEGEIHITQFGSQIYFGDHGEQDTIAGCIEQGREDRTEPRVDTQETLCGAISQGSDYEEGPIFGEGTLWTWLWRSDVVT